MQRDYRLNCIILLAVKTKVRLEPTKNLKKKPPTKTITNNYFCNGTKSMYDGL